MTERGYVEAAQTTDVYCNVEGQTTIIRIVPEGQRVKAGDILCQLDSAALKDQLVNQRITTKSAEANFLNAKLTREVAEIAMTEYRGRLQAGGRGPDAGDRRRPRGDPQDRGAAGADPQGERAAQGRPSTDAGGAKTAADIVAEVDIQDRIEEAELSLERERRSLAGGRDPSACTATAAHVAGSARPPRSRSWMSTSATMSAAVLTPPAWSRVTLSRSLRLAGPRSRSSVVRIAASATINRPRQVLGILPVRCPCARNSDLSDPRG